MYKHRRSNNDAEDNIIINNGTTEINIDNDSQQYSYTTAT